MVETGIPELFKAWIGGLIRWALTGVLGHFVAAGILSADQAEQTAMWIIASLAVLVWSWIQKFRAQREIERLRGER